MTKQTLKFFKLRNKHIDDLKWDGPVVCLTALENFDEVLGPDAKSLGSLTEPREFNLMFKTFVGALSGEEGAAFLRPETAQGIFVNFKNVLDSTRHRLPLGIAQLEKVFGMKSRLAISLSGPENLSRWRLNSFATQISPRTGTATGVTDVSNGITTWASQVTT